MGAMVACSDDLPDPTPQQWPDEPAFKTEDLAIAQTASSLDLKSYNAANEFAPLADITVLQNFPLGYDLVFKGEVSGTNDFAKVSTFNTQLTDSVVMVNPDVLNGAIQDAITKNPVEQHVFVRLAAYAKSKIGNTEVRLGGADKFYGNYEYTVLPLDPTKVIEENYYLVGSFCNWDIKKAIKMSNTVAGSNQYDNPVFAVKFDVSVAGTKWMVIPESTYQSGKYEDGAYGTVPNASGTGGLLRATNAQDSEAGVINNVGPMLVSINMNDDTYTSSFAFDVLYAFTSARNPWTLQTEDYFNYSGVAQITTQAYIAQEPKMSGVIIFNQDKEKTPELVANESLSGDLVGSLNGTGGDRLTMPIKGKAFYWVEVNFVNMTYKFSAIHSIRVVGSGNGWNEKEGPMLTPSSNYKTWTAKDVVIGDIFKLNCNEAWTLDFGGKANTTVVGNSTTYNLEYKGDNMEATPGTYDVTVDFSVYPYTVTLTKK